MTDPADDDTDFNEEKFEQMLSSLTADQLYVVAANAADWKLASAALNRHADLKRDVENRARANSVVEPLEMFVEERGLDGEDAQTQIGDLICNALHLCERQGGDPFRAARQGIGNYAAELVCSDGLGPELHVSVTLNGIEPQPAIQAAQQQMRIADR